MPTRGAKTPLVEAFSSLPSWFGKRQAWQADSGLSKVEDRDLTVESHDSGRNERFFETSANVIEDVARLGIVGTVQSDIAFGNKLLQFFESRSVIYRNDFNLGVYGFQRLLRFRLYSYLSAPHCE